MSNYGWDEIQLSSKIIPVLIDTAIRRDINNYDFHEFVTFAAEKAA